MLQKIFGAIFLVLGIAIVVFTSAGWIGTILLILAAIALGDGS